VSANESLVHGTCIALGPRAALLRGPPGAGKSDLALRFLAMYGGAGGDAAALISDDQTRLVVRGRELIASAPEAIEGQLEVRGVGIVDVATRAEAVLALVVDLVDGDEIERLPANPGPREAILGMTVPVCKLAPLEASAPVKLKLALDRAP
jgi:HPr kinase/phosphorylase